MGEKITLSGIRARLGDYLTAGEKGALIAFEKQIAELKGGLKKEEDSCEFYQKMALQLKDKFLEAKGDLRKCKAELDKIKIYVYDKYGMTAKDMEKAK